MTTVRQVRMLSSESRSRYWPSFPARLRAWRMYRKVVPKAQACCQVSWASLAPLMPWEKPG